MGRIHVFFNSEIGNMYFDLEVFVHIFEIFRGSFCFEFDLHVEFLCHVLRGSVIIKIHEMFVIIKKREIVSLKGYT